MPPLHRPGHIAIFPKDRLLDSLLSLVLANQLRLLGHRITIYSSLLPSLGVWLPSIEIVLPFVKESIEKRAKQHDYTIALDSPLLGNLESSPQLAILRYREMNKRCSVLKNVVDYLKRVWLFNATDDAGIRIPLLRHRENNRQVVIYPGSSTESKNWTPKKFVELAQELILEGIEPIFCLSPSEAPDWLWVDYEEGIPIHISLSLEDAANLLYTAGCFIGNDSGLGHLASLLHIPTISLFAQKKQSRFWRPSWGPGRVITPIFPLPSMVQKKYWRQLLSTRQVVQTYFDLIDLTCFR